MSAQPTHQSARRTFLRATLAFVALLAGCSWPGRGKTVTPPPGATGTPRVWQWEVRWIRSRPAAPELEGDRGWRLRIDGLVAEPRELSMADLRALPRAEQRSRMKCVECWSAPAVWRGVSGATLLALAAPRPEAGYVTIHSADGYTSALPVEDLHHHRSLFAYDMDGEELPPDHGFPLRLIVPALYGYKGPKSIQRLEFAERWEKGYWENRGYDNEGVIQPGTDRPLDLDGVRQIGMGEITDY